MAGVADRVFEWDEGKRQATLAKHGIDFIDAVAVFDADPLIIESRRDGEPRWLAIGMMGGVAVTVVHTVRGDTTRIITVRKARRNERRWIEDHPRHPG